MTKKYLREALQNGIHLSALLEIQIGEAEIFKADKFVEGEDILYFPDLWLIRVAKDQKIPATWPQGFPARGRVPDKDALEEVMSHCYTGDDFLKKCGGDRELAERVFNHCVWQDLDMALLDTQMVDSPPV